MMPTCAYKRCRRVAENNLGKINTEAKDGYNQTWAETVYVCEKHYHKLLKLLGFAK